MCVDGQPMHRLPMLGCPLKPFSCETKSPSRMLNRCGEITGIRALKFHPHLLGRLENDASLLDFVHANLHLRDVLDIDRHRSERRFRLKFRFGFDEVPDMLVKSRVDELSFDA